MSSLTLVRLGLVRFASSLMVVLTTGVINRIFIADLHYTESGFALLLSLQQLATPLTLVTGYWSDVFPLWGRHRVPHIVLWGTAASVALASMIVLLGAADERQIPSSVAFLLSAVAMLVFGLGVKASNLLITALLVDRLSLRRRAGALTFVWAMAIFGLSMGGWLYAELFRSTTSFELEHLVRVTLATCAAAAVLTWVAVIGVEPRARSIVPTRPRYPFWPALTTMLRNRHTQLFFGTLVLAEFSFYLQDLILEVYGGRVFQLSVSDTTEYNLYHGLGTLLGMTLLWSWLAAMAAGPRNWQLPGACLLGMVAFGMLVGSAVLEDSTLVIAAILLMGFAKGAYNVALATWLMEMVDRRIAGVILGIWGTTSGIAIAAGMFGGGLLRQLLFQAAQRAQVSVPLATRISFAGVFALELFGLLLAALILLRFRLPAYREQLARELDAIFH